MDAPPASRWQKINGSGGDSRPLLWKLEKALELENSFPPSLRMPTLSKDTEEVTLGMRNGCAQVLRCLKVWYELPSEVLFLATTHLDHFLSRMKVRPKHLSVIALSCFHLAARQVASNIEDCNDFLLSNSTTPFNVPDPRDLLVISQCRCSLGDLSRMEAIVADKLSFPSQGATAAMKSPNNESMAEGKCSTSRSVQQDVPKNKMTSCHLIAAGSVLPKDSSMSVKRHPILGNPPISSVQVPFSNPPLPLCPATPAYFLHIFHSFLVDAEVSNANKSGAWSVEESREWLTQVSPHRLLHHLEAIACDGSLSCFRPSEIALSLICVMLDQILGSVTCLSAPSVTYNTSRQTQALWMLSCTMDIQKLCKIADTRFSRCHSAVSAVIGYYESQHDASRWYRSDGSHDEDDEMSVDEDDDEESSVHVWRKHNYSMKRRNPGAYVEGWGPLAWRVSQRTLRNLRPTDKLVSWPPMPTIHEYSLSCRIRSCSLSSEESSDPGEEDDEENETKKSQENADDWRTSLSPPRWSTMNPLMEEEGSEE